MALTSLGLVKTTLVDYPDEVAATLFTAGCNLRCPYCHNPRLVTGPAPDDFLPVEEVLSFLHKRRGVLGGVCITGGEPLLHEELPDLVARIKTLGYRVKVDTNGTFPERIRAQRADYIAMDLKCAPERYPTLWPGAGSDAPQRIRDAIQIIRASTPRYEFRTTVAPGVVTVEDMHSIAELLMPGDRYVLTAFRPGTTLDPTYANVHPPGDQLLKQMCAAVSERGIACMVRM